MNGLILAAVLASQLSHGPSQYDSHRGQWIVSDPLGTTRWSGPSSGCVGGTCPQPLRLTQSSTILRPEDRHHVSCRVIVNEGNGVVGYGSGTILGGNNGWSLVVTNRHVVGRANRAVVRHFSGDYDAAVLARGSSADLAALVIKTPPNNPQVVLAAPGDAARGSWAMTFGYPYSGNQLQPHQGTVTDTAGMWLDHPIVDGESGAGIFNRQGYMIGVGHSSDHQTMTKAVTTAELCDFIERRVTVSPFFFKIVCRRSSGQPAQPVYPPDPQPIYVNPPVPLPPTPNPAPVPPSVVVGQPGPVGPTGPIGPIGLTGAAGKDGLNGQPGTASNVDLTAILARLTALETATTQITGLLDKPITFVTPSHSGGAAQTQMARLGESIGMKIPAVSQDLLNRISALEAKVK